MKVHIADSEYTAKLAGFLELYVEEVKKAYEQASKLLPFGSRHINFYVKPNKYFIKETGNGGHTVDSELVVLSFDQALGLGEKKILGNVRALVFHEMNHAARYHKLIWHTTVLDMCLMEGLATVFERKCADADPLWGKYDIKVIKKWVKEVGDLPNGRLSDEYWFSHPDGRRWIGYKVGTYIIDEAMTNSDKTIVDLTQMECQDILRLAKVA